MKYQPPFVPGAVPGAPGIFNADPDASYVNGNPETGTEGSYFPNKAIEDPQREIIAAVKAAGLTPDHLALSQLAQAIGRHASGAIQAACTNVGDAYTLVSTGITADHFSVPSVLFDGMIVETIPSATNTGAATANVFGLGSKAVNTWENVALVGGELASGRPTRWKFSVAANAWLIDPWALAMADTGWQKLPFYPHIETATNKLAITNNGNGTLTVDAAQNILWRGWSRVSTTSFSAGNRTVATAASKTYHLRLVRDAAAFVLKDLSDVAYNPSALAETNAAFDSTYDDMLVALVTTNGANVATVTPLANAVTLTYTGMDSTTSYGYTASGVLASLTPTSSPRIQFQYYVDMAGYCASAFALNWARTPKAVSVAPYVSIITTTNPGAGLEGGANRVNTRDVTRYGATYQYSTDWSGSTTGGGPIFLSGTGKVTAAYASCDFTATA